MELRAIPVPGFSEILLVYETTDSTETVLIYRILHGKRDWDLLI